MHQRMTVINLQLHTNNRRCSSYRLAWSRLLISLRSYPNPPYTPVDLQSTINSLNYNIFLPIKDMISWNRYKTARSRSILYALLGRAHTRWIISSQWCSSRSIRRPACCTIPIISRLMWQPTMRWNIGLMKFCNGRMMGLELLPCSMRRICPPGLHHLFSEVSTCSGFS